MPRIQDLEINEEETLLAEAMGLEDYICYEEN